MTEPPEGSEPGWYRSPDDPMDTHRYWDGDVWVGDAEPLPASGDRSAPGSSEPFAPGGLRILARLIDTLINGVAFVVMAALVDGEIAEGTPSVTASLLALGFAAIYEIVMVASFGATVGKLALGIRVVDIEGNCPPALDIAARRWTPNLLTILPVLGYILSLAILVVSLAWIFSDSQRRSLFDRVGPTFVVVMAD